MTDKPQPISEQQVDAYLDGLMKLDERVAFEVLLRDHPEIVKEVRLQEQIDTSMKLLFPEQHVSEQQVNEVLAAAAQPTQAVLSLRNAKHTLRIGLVGLAACLAWIIVAWQLGDQPTETPFFQLRPVALVYQEVVENGFVPYYECHEEDRFEATFLRRQGQALTLATLPAGSRMLGLSYAGGLSRDTTAMLCEIDEQPVIVFVDRLANDLPIAAQHDSSKTKVHRIARDGLVFYEVSPFEDSRVIKYLVPKKEM